MSEKLGTCVGQPRCYSGNHPHNKVICDAPDTWREPVASPQATRRKVEQEIANNMCRAVDALHGERGEDDAAQPAAGTTPPTRSNRENVTCVSTEERGDGTRSVSEQSEISDTRPSPALIEGTTPQAERPSGTCLRVKSHNGKTPHSKSDDCILWKARAVAPVETPPDILRPPASFNAYQEGNVETRLTAEQFFQEWRKLQSYPDLAHADWPYVFAEAFRDKSEAELPHEGLTAAQFADSDGWKFGADAKQTAYRFAEEYSAIWQRIAARLEAQNAGLREEIERFRREADIAVQLHVRAESKLRAKLAEQERERDLHALLRGICEEVIDWLATLSYDGVWETNNVLEHPLTKDIRLKLQQMYDHPLDNKLLIRTDVLEAKLERAEAAEAEAAALRERERWIPVEEKLPEESNARFEVYAIRANGQHIREFSYWHKELGFAELEDQAFPQAPKITHWKALSAAPERT